MKLNRIKTAADPESSGDQSIGNSRLSILWLATLALVVCLFIISGCGGDSSDATESESESAATSSESTATVSEISSSIKEWAPLYDGQFPLYQDKIPNSILYDLEETSAGEDDSIRYYNVSFPTLSIFLPPEDIATGAAVIICPGGGYYYVSCGSGYIAAEALAEHGIAAFVLKYRLPNDLIMADKSTGPLQDAQEAIKTVRQRAEEWNIDPAKVGIMGHSAGGHVAASASVHYDDTYIVNEEGTDLRPSFVALVSSVLSMEDDITHAGSKARLLGDDPEEELVEYFSCELQVTEDTPPAWIAHAENDTIVMVENSELLYDELVSNGVSAELNLYATGGHSFFWNVTANDWLESLLYWLEAEGITESE